MIKKIHCLKYQKANPKKRDIALLWNKVPRWMEIPFGFHNWIGWIALCIIFCKIHFGSNLDLLGVSKGHAYKLIRELNKELQSKGYLVVAGKVPKAFWETKFYGYNKPNQTA